MKFFLLFFVIMSISSCTEIHNAQEERIAEQTLSIINDKLSSCDDLYVDFVAIPRFAAFKKNFEAKVFLKNKNNPDFAISIKVQITATGVSWSFGEAYYSISGFDLIKLSLAC